MLKCPLARLAWCVALLVAGPSLAHRGRGGPDTGLCAERSRDPGSGVLVLDLTLRDLGTKGDEGGYEAALIVAHDLAETGERVAFASFADGAASARKDAPVARHARRLLFCHTILSPRKVPPAAALASAGYGEPAASRAAASRSYAEGLLDALHASPFATTLVLVAAPTRIAVCDAPRLVASLHALHRSAKGRSGCDRGLVATLGGRPRGRGQRFGFSLAAFMVSGDALLRSWFRLLDELSAHGLASPHHALREAVSRDDRVLWRDLLLSPLDGPLAEGATNGSMARAAGAEASGGCFACGGGDRAAAKDQCRATLCGRGCAIAFNCTDHREYRFQHAQDLSTAKAIAWAILHGETCALRASLVPPDSSAPDLLERVSKAKTHLFQNALTEDSTCRKGRMDARGDEDAAESMDIGAWRRRRFVLLTLPAPDEPLAEPWLHFAAAKQAYARKQGYASEMLLSSRVALTAAAEAAAVQGPRWGATGGRCEYLRPLMVLDALFRHAADQALDYALVTSHASFVAPTFFNASLDSFVEAAEAQGRDFIFPDSSLSTSVFFVRNTIAGRMALLEWWGVFASGAGGGCVPFEMSGLQLMLLRRIDRHNRNQEEANVGGAVSSGTGLHRKARGVTSGDGMFCCCFGVSVGLRY